MLKLIIIYLIFQTVYVILNTIKSILTIKSTKLIASISSAICYAVYVFVLIYTVADFPIWIKALLTAITNLFGTYISMYILEHLRKDKLWEITATAKTISLGREFRQQGIGYNITSTQDGEEYVYHIYSKSKADSEKVKKLLQQYNAKYIVHEETVKL